jgi:hypothetical protein
LEVAQGAHQRITGDPARFRGHWRPRLPTWRNSRAMTAASAATAIT